MSKLAVKVLTVAGLPPPAADSGVDPADVKVYCVMRLLDAEGETIAEARSPAVAATNTDAPMAEKEFALQFEHVFAPVEQGKHTLSAVVWGDSDVAFPKAISTSSAAVSADGPMGKSSADWTAAAPLSTDAEGVQLLVRFRPEWAAEADDAATATTTDAAADDAGNGQDGGDGAKDSPAASSSKASSAAGSRKSSVASSGPKSSAAESKAASTNGDADSDDGAAKSDTAPEETEPEEEKEAVSKKEPTPPPSTARSRRAPSKFTATAMDPVPPESYRLLSTVPCPPSSSFTARRTEPRVRTAVEGPAPNKYHHELSWSNRPGAKISALTPRSKPIKEQPAPPLLNIRPKWGDRSVSFGFRPVVTAERERRIAESAPAPGTYTYSGDSMATTIDTKNRMSTAKCTFGTRRAPAKKSDVPGPSAYAGDVLGDSPRRDQKGARMSSRVKPPQPYNTPGPGEYKVRGIGDSEQGQIPMTMKARLPHPMDSKLAEFDSAKTSCPRLPNRTMRARPRL